MTSTRSIQVIVSCEHACHAVPPRWRPLFDGAEGVLRSHRGWDIGAGPVAEQLAHRLAVPVHLGEQTRLLVDLNRSPRHPRLFSEWTRGLPPEERAEILERHYFPYRSAIEDRVRPLRRGEQVVHVSIHSFTPVLNGRMRPTDVGLLYDPKRPRERELGVRLQAELRRRSPAGWRIHRNRPYLGVSDGLIPFLRRRHPASRYLGIEIEMNQRHLANPRDVQRLGVVIAEGVAAALGESTGQ